MKLPARFFRAGVGAVITDGRGHVLVCERADIPGAWQFPQGGLEKDETPLDAALREAQEETGLPSTSLRLRRRYPGLLAYELPESTRSTTMGMGQVQYWFLFALRAGVDPTVHPPPNTEFSSAKWTSFTWAVARTVAFRRPLYRRLQQEFGAAVGERL
jgi:putative (di)nucleoside polyphosphate hydrolase